MRTVPSWHSRFGEMKVFKIGTLLSVCGDAAMVMKIENFVLQDCGLGQRRERDMPYLAPQGRVVSITKTVCVWL